MLTRYAAGAVTFHQILDFGDCNLIEITEYRMLQTGCGDGEVQRLLVIAGPGQHTVDQAAHETVATADTVHDVGDVVARRLEH